MTLHKPTILVDRLVVKRNGNSVMDISFHAGLNVITGENSSGKTTAIRFIAYALGSESISFNQMAQLCDDIYLEITANEAVVTLCSHVSTQLMQPLSIFWGGIADRDECRGVNVATIPLQTERIEGELLPSDFSTAGIA